MAGAFETDAFQDDAFEIEATGAVALDGAASGSSGGVARLSGSVPVTGAATGSSSGVGVLSGGSVELAGAASGSSTGVGALSTPTAGAFESGAFQNDAFETEATGAVALSGAATGSSSGASTLTRTVGLFGSATGSSSGLSSLIEDEVPLVGAATGGSTGSALLGTTAALVGATTGASAAASALSVSIKFVGAASGTSAGASSARIAVALRGAATGDSSVVGGLVSDLSAAGSAAGTSRGAGRLLTTSPGVPVDPSLALLIAYDNLDVTADVITSSARFISAANGQPGSATLRVRDTGHTHGFVVGKHLQCKINGVAEWTGYVSGVRRGYFLLDAKDPNSKVRFFELSGLDLNTLFAKRVLYDKVTPTNVADLSIFPAGSDDGAILRAYMDLHLDLSGDDLTTDLIENVGTPSTDSLISASGGWMWQDLMQFLTRETGGVYYIDPDRNVVLTDVDTPNAPFGISDRPGPGQIGCRELEIDFVGDKMVNDALVWGAGQGSQSMVFKRVEDNDSIAAHHRWQTGQLAMSVWQQASVDRIADSYVYGSPQNKRGGKDDAVAARATIFTPGIRVGLKVAVESEVFGFSDVLPCRMVELDFVGRAPRWRVTLSHEIDSPWMTYEFWYPPIDWEGPPLLDPVLPDPYWPDPWPPFDPCACAEGEEGTVIDTLERTHGLGVTTGQWNTADNGDDWSTHFNLGAGSVGGGGVSGSYGYLRFEPANGDNDAWANLDTAVLNGGDFDITAEFSFFTTADGTGSNDQLHITLGIGPATGDDPGNDAAIELFMDAVSPGDGEIGLIDDGSVDTPFTIAPNTHYKLRWERNQGANISRVKIWSGSEPGTWTLEDAPWSGADADRLTFHSQRGSNDVPDGETIEARLHDIRESGGSVEETFGRVTTAGWGPSEINAEDWDGTSNPSNSVDGDEGLLSGSQELAVDGNWSYPIEILIKLRCTDPGDLSVQLYKDGISDALEWGIDGGFAAMELYVSGGGLFAQDDPLVNFLPGGEDFWLRLRADETEMSIAVWEDGGSEPSPQVSDSGSNTFIATTIDRLFVSGSEWAIDSIEIVSGLDGECVPVGELMGLFADGFADGGHIAGWGAVAGGPGGTWALVDGAASGVSPVAFSGNRVDNVVRLVGGVNTLWWGGKAYLGGWTPPTVTEFLLEFVIDPLSPSDNASGDNLFRVMMAGTNTELIGTGMGRFASFWWNRSSGVASGYDIGGGGVVAYSFVEGERYSFRYKHDNSGGSIEFKFWRTDDGEPASWSSTTPEGGSGRIAAIAIRLEPITWPTGTTGMENGISFWLGYGEGVVGSGSGGGNPCGDADPGEFADPPVSGQVCERLTRTFIDGDGDQHMRATSQFEPRTMRVWADGRFLQRNIHYIEHPLLAKIEIFSDVDLGGWGVEDPTRSVYACYVATDIEAPNRPVPI